MRDALDNVLSPVGSAFVFAAVTRPLASTVRCTAGSWLWLSKPACASDRLSPVRMTCFLTMMVSPLRSTYFSSPKGTGPPPTAAAAASALLSTRRISSVAVRPMMSIAANQTGGTMW